MVQLLDIPEDDAELGLWLESLLVSRDFGDLVSQLAFLRQGLPPVESPNISEETKEAIIKNGLSEVSQDQRRQLFKSPELLIELNERIFENGSQYWMSKLEPSHAAEDQFFENTAASIFGTLSSSESQNDVTELSSVAKSAPSSSGVSRRQLLAMAASILAIVCGVYLFQSAGPQSNTPWGWQSAQAMPKGASANEYFLSLGGSAEEWFDQKSTTADMLASNLQSLSNGCQRLIDAPHGALSSDQRAWLIEKCGAWKKDIDQLLADAKAILVPGAFAPSQAADTGLLSMAEATTQSVSNDLVINSATATSQPVQANSQGLIVPPVVAESDIVGVTAPQQAASVETIETELSDDLSFVDEDEETITPDLLGLG